MFLFYFFCIFCIGFLISSQMLASEIEREGGERESYHFFINK